MPETPRFYRLRIRNAADSADLVVFTSVRGGTNPYIAGPPSGDGQSFVPLTGESSTGSYTLHVVDEGSVASAVTGILADVNARQQLLSKRAFLESSLDGTTWTGFVPGYCNGVRLVSAAKYEFAIGDSRREEVSTDVFKSVLLKRGAKTAAGMPGLPTFTRFPNATMLIGGPTKEGFWSATDRGGWVVKVTQVNTSGAANTHYVQLKVQSFGYFDPRDPLAGLDEFPKREFVNYLNEQTQPYFRRSVNWESKTISGFFPEMLYRLETTARVLAGYFTPLAEPYGVGVKRNDYITRTGGGSSFWVAWTQSIQPLTDPFTGAAAPGAGTTLAAPSVGAEYRLYLHATDISEKNPLHIVAHPMDVQEKLWLDANMPYDATALAAVRAAIGTDTLIALRPTSSYTLGDVQRMLGGLFGYATRIDSLGRFVPFTTRIKGASPVAVYTIADLRSAEGTGWEVEESTVSNRITLKQLRFSNFTEAHEQDAVFPPDTVATWPDTMIVDYGAATTPGDHETVYDIPGRLFANAQTEMNAEDFVVGIAGEAFDRYGQGALGGELHFLPSMTAQLGDEVILDMIHLPNAIAGRSPVSQRGGQRIVQIVQRTETPSGPDIRYVDAGTTVQAVTVPTFTLGLNATDGRRYADLVVTNAGALAAAGIKVRIEIASGAGAPTSGTLLTVLDPALVTALTLPAADAGTKVWVRMRSELTGNRPSAWTAFTGLQLTVLNPPTSFAVAAQGADISKRLLTWVVGTNASDIPVEVYLRLTADPASADRLIVTLPPGSTQYELIGLDVANRTATVRHKEAAPAGGFSTSATVAVNTTGSSGTLSAPTDPTAFSGPVAGLTPFGRVTEVNGVFGLSVTATADASIEFEVAIGAGGYNSTEIKAALTGQRITFSSTAPNDGLVRHMRARHVKPTWTSSAYTTVADATPWTVFNPTDPTQWKVKASDIGGGKVDPVVVESGLKPVNRLFAKPLPADPDTLDSAPDGASYAKILGSRLSSGAILRAGAWSDGDFGARATNNTGLNLHSSVLESGTKPVNKLFAKALAADPDTLDSAPDGSTFKKTTANQRDGGGYGFLGLASNGDLTGDIDGDTEVQSGHLYVDTAKRVKIGTIATPGTITRTMRIPFGELVPLDDTIPFAINSAAGYIYPRTVNVTASLVGAVILPDGARIEAFRARHYRNDINDVSRSWLQKTDGTTLTNISALILSTNGAWTTLADTSPSELVDNSGNTVYYLEVSLTTNVGSAATEARFAWAEIEYTIPDLGVGF